MEHLVHPRLTLLLALDALLADVDVVDAIGILRVRHRRRAHRRLGDGVHRNLPAIILLLEVVQAVVRHAVGYDVEDAGRLQHARHLRAHLGHIRRGTLAAEDSIHGRLGNDGVEGLIGEVQRHDVHHLPRERRLVLVALGHLVDDHLRDVNVREVREAILEHVLGQARVAAARHEDGVILLDVLGNEILQARVPLVPVEGLRVLRVPLVPVLKLACDMTTKETGAARCKRRKLDDCAKAWARQWVSVLGLG
mmetsp:Transcript_7717/g.22273  ORF Transcript_7717/g.22273 Transcript_7717/m.22273 type:complete len:251 (+) Transcript_7717:2090-2842(+)